MASPPCLSSSSPSPPHPPASQSLPTSAAGLESNVTIPTHLSLLQLLCHFCSWMPATSTARTAPLTDPTETYTALEPTTIFGGLTGTLGIRYFGWEYSYPYFC
ncbi:hypothetical protein Fot_13496 [Forsythia ovata]|uniref:Uncharacterized protein n=1 Tax=Forsythia ovata TaxID=205694 RepID=A0ABD1W652_9LAMI